MRKKSKAISSKTIKKPIKKSSTGKIFLTVIIPVLLLLLAWRTCCQNDVMIRENREARALGKLVYFVQPLYVGKTKYDYFTFYLKNISTGESLKVKNVFIEFTSTINRDFSNVDIHNDLKIQALFDGNKVSIPTKNLEISPGFDYPFCFFVLSGGTIKSVSVESQNAKKLDTAYQMTNTEITDAVKKDGGSI